MSLAKLFLLLIFFSACTALQNKKKQAPEIIPKEQWGGKKHFAVMPEHEIAKITIHHGGTEVSQDREPTEYLQNLQKFSMDEKKWMDIPYHFTIDLNGKIYECRPIQYPGDTNTEYDPTGHALINVIGNYEIQKISEQQLNAIIQLSAWLVEKYNISADQIAGHKDFSTMTVCPGQDLYKYLEDGTIITRVKKIINNSN